MEPQKQFEICDAAITKHGAEAQIRMVQEECAELIVACSKYCRFQNDIVEGRASLMADAAKAASELLIEEIADVEIMLIQLHILIGDEEWINEMRDTKLNRLASRLGLIDGNTKPPGDTL